MDKITKPFVREALCTGCTFSYDDTYRFPVWRIAHVDADCIAHGYMTRVNVAAIIRYAD